MLTNRVKNTASEPERSGRVDFAEVLALARRGDSQSLGQLLQWYVNYLTILATTQLDQRIRQRVSPSDVVQEALLAAHRDLSDFRGQSQCELLGWLRKILIGQRHFALNSGEYKLEAPASESAQVIHSLAFRACTAQQSGAVQLINTLHREFATHVKAGKRDVRREISMFLRAHGSICCIASPHAPHRSSASTNAERDVAFFRDNDMIPIGADNPALDPVAHEASPRRASISTSLIAMLAFAIAFAKRPRRAPRTILGC